MEIKQEDFKKIVDFVKTELLKHKLLVNAISIKTGEINDVPMNAVSEFVILGMPEAITLEKFLRAVNEKKERAKPKPIADDKGFEEFWLTYPATPTFKHKGRTFTDSRTLRSNKEVCRTKYLNYLHDNPQVTPELMLKALKIQLNMAKDESVEQGSNRLARWNGLEVYINQAKFEPFLEMAASEDGEYSESGEDSDNTSNVA